LWVAAIISSASTQFLAAAPTILAHDDSMAPAYASGWHSGSNGGSGFTPWVLGPDDTGFFIETSSDNGIPPSGNIDKGGVSWGMHGGYAADRSFAIGPLATNQTLSFAIDPGDPAGPAPSGFYLMQGPAHFAMQFEVYYNNYLLQDATGQSQAGFDPTVRPSDGIEVSITLTNPGNYHLVMIATGKTYVYDRPLNSTDPITGIEFFDGSYYAAKFFVNDLTISVPEPRWGHTSALILCLGGQLRCRRSRSIRWRRRRASPPSE
jgi:hypothetical protein